MCWWWFLVLNVQFFISLCNLTIAERYTTKKVRQTENEIWCDASLSSALRYGFSVVKRTTFAKYYWEFCHILILFFPKTQRANTNELHMTCWRMTVSIIKSATNAVSFTVQWHLRLSTRLCQSSGQAHCATVDVKLHQQIPSNSLVALINLHNATLQASRKSNHVSREIVRSRWSTIIVNQRAICVRKCSAAGCSLVITHSILNCR